MAAIGKEEPPLRVVAFGASAGGLQALRPIINELEGDGLTAFLVAHHLAPTQATTLVELLAAQSRLEVVAARHGEALRADCVHVCPPGHDIEFADGAIRLIAADPASHCTPSINRLFRSLAEVLGEKAVGVIVSGSGNDGTLGAEAINGVNGCVIVQSPDEAMQPGMPQSVISAGFAELIGNGSQISAWLNNLENLGEAISPVVADATAQAFTELFQKVGDATGLALAQYKENTLRRQTIRRYRALGLGNLDEYLGYVNGQPDELAHLQQTFMISVSSFFRDASVFDTLERALRKAVAGRRSGDSLRVWVPACATGEEPYSIAIVLAEILGERLGKFNVRIFATDIDHNALEFARSGVYPTSALAHLTAVRRQRWFTADNGNWRIAKAIRELCVFSLHDVIANPPFIKVDLISCRNLLIYFKPELQAELINTFHYSLNPDGILLLGKSEAAGFNSRLFETVDSEMKLYRRRTATAAHPARYARFGVPSPLHRPLMTATSISPKRQTLVDTTLINIARRYSPPGVLVNGSFEPLHFFGNSQRYFALPVDPADFSVFSLCLPRLRSELKALCYRLVQENLDALEGARVDLNVDGEDVRIRPVLNRIAQPAGDEDLAFLIVFEEISAAKRADDGSVHSAEDLYAEENVRLRQELADSREHLQAVIEELEASNEELQSLNEEVQSSSEELQSSNEELQSSNEELTTLNDELRVKSLEAIQLTTTISNIQDSVRTSLVVVDHDGRITRFNPLATRIFGLMTNDIGQFLYGVPCHLQLPKLREQVGEVVAEGVSLVEKVQQGNFQYLMQIDPYRDEAGATAGAVLTFSDISDLHRAELAQQSSEIRFRQVWEASIEGLIVVNDDSRIVLANPASEAMFGYTNGELLQQKLEVLVPATQRRRHLEQSRAFLRKPGLTRQMSLIRGIAGLRQDGSEFPVEISLSHMQVDGENYVLASVSDITERKAAEDKLLASKAKFEAALASMSDAVLIADEGGELVEFNDAFASFHRFKNKAECAQAFAEHADLIEVCTLDGTFAPAEQRPVARALRGETASNAEYLLRRKDLDASWIASYSFAPIRNENGIIVGAVVAGRDITEQRLAEGALRQSELRLRLALDAARAGSWEWHLANNENVWSDEIWNLYGLDRGAIPASFASWQSSMHENDHERVVRTIVDAAALAVEFETEWQVKLADEAAPRYVLARGRPVLDADGEPTHYIGITLDITARKRAEAELEQYRDKLELLVKTRTTQFSELYNSAPCGYHSLDADGRFTNVNDTELAWLGYTREEMIGRMRALDVIAPHHHDVFHANYPRFMATGELQGLEFDFVRKDGSLLPVLLHSRAVFDEAGKFEHALSTIIDNTDRKKAEAAWVAAREAAESANRAKSAFLANMSHEIRTPLNAIIGFAHIMRRGEVDAQQTEQLDKINAAAQHLLAVISDILDLSKIESGKHVLDKTDFDLRRVAANIVAMLQGPAASKGVELRSECDPFAYQVIGDPTRFAQAFLNLASNAVKFTHQGTITLRVRRLEERNGQVLIRVEVEDAGIGIPKDVLPRLFSAFEQGDTSKTRKYGGTGLGLVITKRLAELMGGNAGAYRNIGAGSTFWFTAWLDIAARQPVAAQELDDGRDDEAALRRDHRGARILLVEDDPVGQEVANIVLVDLGLHVTIAANGAEAVELARTQQFALVLMDMQMPVMDGVEATLQIRQLPHGAALPIVAMTANAFAEDRAACLAAGMSDFITKPFDPARLVSTLRRLLAEPGAGPV